MVNILKSDTYCPKLGVRLMIPFSQPFLDMSLEFIIHLHDSYGSFLIQFHNFEKY